MPFTFAHPSIVLPFALASTKKVSITGLIIGSMVPDFIYFFSLSDESYLGHTWIGIPVLNLPVAIIFSYFYHHLLKEPLTLNLPKFFRRKFDSFLLFNWHDHVKGHFVSVIFSITIGIFSHLAWDIFTHFNSATFKVFPFLLFPIRLSDNYVIGLFVLIWYLSTVIGLIVVVLVIYNLPSTKMACSKPLSRAFWKITFIWFIIILSSRTLYNPNYKNPQEFAIVTIGSLIWSIIVTCAYTRAKNINKKFKKDIY